MARRLHKTLVLRGTLETDTPLHVGGAGEGLEVDMALALDGQDRFYVPGSSLAGAIRAWLRRAIGDRRVTNWLGFQGEPGTDQGAASRLSIEDAPVVLPDGAVPEIWHGVGIDREWGAAARGIKFEREVLPKGSRLPFDLRLDLGTDEDLATARAALLHLARALERGRVGLGAAGTRGLGRVRLLEGWAGLERDWSDRQGILAILRAPHGGTDARGLWGDAAETLQLESTKAVEIEVHWQPLGPLMVKAPRDGLAVDALPMVSADGTAQTLVLPGSGIKGVLRGQAERILRTVLDRDAHWRADGRQRQLEQLDVPLVRNLFGSARPGGRPDPTTARGQRGALSVATCYATNTRRSRAQWASILDAAGAGDGQPSPLPNRFAEQGLRFQHAHHVAVDRWTGGAADALLFTGIEPFGVTWEPLRLRLDLDRMAAHAEGSAKAGLALAWLVLRDLWEGSLGLGFGVNRGYGALRVERIEIAGLDSIDQDWPARATLAIADRRPANTDALGSCLSALQSHWQAWVETQREQRP